jgi:hypothetical protein
MHVFSSSTNYSSKIFEGIRRLQTNCLLSMVENQAKNREAAALLRRAANLLNTDSSGSGNVGSSCPNSSTGSSDQANRQADQGGPRARGAQRSPLLNTSQVQPPGQLP